MNLHLNGDRCAWILQAMMSSCRDLLEDVVVDLCLNHSVPVSWTCRIASSLCARCVSVLPLMKFDFYQKSSQLSGETEKT